MTQHLEQIQRIKSKLALAKSADRALEVFGASDHKYQISRPVSAAVVSEFERKFGVELPDVYKAFVMQVGNGGGGYTNSAPGPFYGIYPFGENVHELVLSNPEKYLKNECLLYPKMTDEYWASLTNRIENDDEGDEDWDDERYEAVAVERGRVFGGILPIGSQGCSYLHGLILNGPHKGKVVNLDMDCQKPKFTFEDHFLDWYERWLDEIISGELKRDDASWFGYQKGGPEEDLLSDFINAADPESKKDNLIGLSYKKTLKAPTLDKIEQLLNTSEVYQKDLLEILCKNSYQKAKPYLLALAKSDLLSVFQNIYYHAREKSGEWVSFIEQNINRIDAEETFRFCTYLLIESKTEYGHLVIAFTRHHDAKIRALAFYALGKLKNKKDYLPNFTEGLNDSSNHVIHTTLQALSDVKDESLLPYFKNLAEKFPVEQDYILSNLNHRLADYGLTNETILEKKPQNPDNRDDKGGRKKWYEIWK